MPLRKRAAFTPLPRGGRLVFTLRDEKGRPYTESEAIALSKERRAAIDKAELELRAEITRFMDKMQPLERVMNEGLAALQRRQFCQAAAGSCDAGNPRGPEEADQDSVKLNAYLEQATHDVLDNLAVFQVTETTRPDWRRLAAYCRACMSI